MPPEFDPHTTHVARRRFTLLEIILCIAILSTIAVLTGTVLFSVQRSWNGIRKSSAELDTRRKLSRIADGAFRNAVPFHWPDETGVERQLFQGRQEELRLVYLHRIHSEQETGLRLLTLYLEKGSLTARYTKYPMADATPDLFATEILAHNVRAVRFRYALREQKNVVWVDEYDAGTEQNIPVAIQMSVEFLDGNTIHFLRRTAGNSQVSSYGRQEEKK